MRFLLPLVLCLIAPPAAAQLDCSDISELNSVYFGFEQIDLGAQRADYAADRLEENLAIGLDRCSEIGVLVTGWGDDKETSPDALSILRATAVAEWYIEQGLEPDRIAVRGSGMSPEANYIEDPNPGDSRARRVDSEPMPLADLPADALGWRSQAAVREDPEPSTVRIADDDHTRIFLVMDWALAADGASSRPASCPESPHATAETGSLVLSSVSLVIGGYDRNEDSPFVAKGREIPLDPACRTAAWPAASLLGLTIAQVVPGVYVLDGTLSPAGGAYTAGWMVGPDGNTPTDGLFCTRYQGLETELNAAVQTLAVSRRAGDAAGARTALDIVTQTSADLRELRADVEAVGGEADGARLDCSELHLAYSG